MVALSSESWFNEEVPEGHRKERGKSKMMHYVIDTRKGYVTHEGNEQSCRQYVSNATSLFGGTFVIVKGAKEREATLRKYR